MTGYQYDADGNRIGKGSITSMSCDITANGYQPQSEYVLSQGGGQVSEMSVDVNGNETWQHTNVTAGGELIATYDTMGLHFYLNDALGTRRAQTNQSGILEQTCQGLPFGDGLNCTLSTVAPTEHHFTGKERDTESGNDYLSARYFGSSMGRFMSPDIVGGDLSNPQSLNRYAYALNNPLVLTDPSGFCPDGDQDGQTTTLCMTVTMNSQTGQTSSTAPCACSTDEVTVNNDDPGLPASSQSSANLSSLVPTGTVGVAQTALDVAGLIPGPVGVVANVASAGISLSQGRYGAAALSLAFAVPIIGQLGAEAHAGLELGEGGYRSFSAFKRAYGQLVNSLTGIILLDKRRVMSLALVLGQFTTLKTSLLCQETSIGRSTAFMSQRPSWGLARAFVSG